MYRLSYNHDDVGVIKDKCPGHEPGSDGHEQLPSKQRNREDLLLPVLVSCRTKE